MRNGGEVLRIEPSRSVLGSRTALGVEFIDENGGGPACGCERPAKPNRRGSDRDRSRLRDSDASQT